MNCRPKDADMTRWFFPPLHASTQPSDHFRPRDVLRRAQHTCLYKPLRLASAKGGNRNPLPFVLRAFLPARPPDGKPSYHAIVRLAWSAFSLLKSLLTIFTVSSCAFSLFRERGLNLLSFFSFRTYKHGLTTYVTPRMKVISRPF